MSLLCDMPCILNNNHGKIKKEKNTYTAYIPKIQVND